MLVRGIEVQTGPTGRDVEIKLSPRPVRYTENGLRTARAHETSRTIDGMIESGFFTDVTRRVHQGSRLPYYVSRFIDPTDGRTQEPHPGKGLSEEQSRVSAAMEGIERYCSKVHGDEVIVTATYRQLGANAVDPRRFVLPVDTTYHAGLEQQWVWGFSLSCGEAKLVPASLVFCPYDTSPPESRICDYNSNGLAAGNCEEEAILQGLLEVVERDAWMIMEYNRLVMPDLRLADRRPRGVRHVVDHLTSLGIAVVPKNITNDIPIHTFGVMLSGMHHGRRAFSHAPGTHLAPQIALTRAVTEAVQLYPRVVGKSEWLSSGPIDHLWQEGPVSHDFATFPELDASDIKECVDRCVALLRDHDSEVIVVDLSRERAHFPVVRVLCTGLQPIINRSNPRYSDRLARVPVELGYRETGLSFDDIELRILCGVK